ncbi:MULTISPECIES: phage tail protein [Edwardsiella]|uniref:Gifsy-1 prophage VhsJ n=2 Tax=Edwardsiella anguillarum TaxID=1821960 RepID=A0A076LJE6_9GAMM|nr:MULTISPECIES: host specificity protein J [Edwardsiella]AIJ06982.1 gifsy-1 prophage VhsJ [Edwardsiella anguillarum ET080813]AKR78395.1 host specificity protein J [Edwardsiella sp. LADL05-105]KAB0593559.1 host specificity protein J [Edwardsiella anguillarum]UOU78132.1 host specificity protein J [Edwardsiella anguillarum]WHP82900.1 host specificity protein J [Edwardsiella anguillarum]
MGKGSGGGHTPYEAPDNLRSSQLLSVIDALSEGPIEGPVDGLQSILVNQTPTVDADGNVNVHGVTVVYRVGEQEQSSLDGFEESGAETMLNAEVKNANPITRTITSKEIDRLRFTFGVSSLVAGTDDGDQVETSVNLSIQVQRAGAWVTEKDVTIQGKRTSQFLASVVVDNLPPRPFGIRMIRNTPDSTSARLQNKTLWSSYTEIIDLQQRYPNTAVVGVRVDAEQFGSQQVTMNYHVRGRIVRVPSNYDPITRVYTGIWDGSFKPAYTNNPAWCLLDLLTHPRYGMGDRMGMADVDIWSLYAIAQYCDQSVPDGFGGTEPRMVCNAYLATQRKVYDVLADFCSLMRCMPVWNGLTMTFVQDRPADKVWTYSNSNVVDGSFKYGFSALKDRHNAVEVRYIDPQNGWKASVELVEDQAAIVRYGRNLLKMEAFGCTSRGQARRMGLWVIQTELLETQTVDFMIGAEGLRHLPGDIIEICDNDYAGVTVGGRILDADTVSRTVTLDRDIALPPGGSAEMNLIGADGSPISIPVVDLPAPNMVRLQTVPAGIQAYGVWGLRLSSMRRRLFRCMMLRENDDGTYAVTALQHVPEKEAIVDNGAHFEPLPGTENGVIPPAIQHLSVSIGADSDKYQALAQWDTPRVVKGCKFLLRLTTGAGTAEDPARLVTSATISETRFSFNDLSRGDYELTVRAMNGLGQQGAPTSTQFSIQVPEAPASIEVNPGYFQITIIPHQTYYHSDVQYEFYFSERRITDVTQVESLAMRLGIATYWVKAGLNKLATEYYFYVRSVNLVGKSIFVESIGQVTSDATGVLDILKGEITDSQMAQDFLKGIDNNLVRDEFNKALDDSETKVDQALTVLESAVGDSKAQLQALSQTVATEDAALSQKIDNVNAQVGENASAVQVISKAQADLKGDVSAMWSMQVQTTQDGKKVIAGIQATAEGGVGQVLILADRFAVMNPNNGSELLPFIIQNGQVIIDEAFMKSLNINDRFIVTPDGQLTIRSHKDSRVGLMMDSDLIQINDESGRPVIKLGDLRKTLV